MDIDTIEHRGFKISIRKNTFESYGKAIGDLWAALAVVSPGVNQREDDYAIGIGMTEPEAKADAVSRARRFIDDNTVE